MKNGGLSKDYIFKISYIYQTLLSKVSGAKGLAQGPNGNITLSTIRTELAELVQGYSVFESDEHKKHDAVVCDASILFSNRLGHVGQKPVLRSTEHKASSTQETHATASSVTDTLWTYWGHKFTCAAWQCLFTRIYLKYEIILNTVRRHWCEL